MTKVDREFGEPNPKAPAELSRFAFLIGKWHCDAKVKSADGDGKNKDQAFHATWTGRYILDGYVIADDYRMTTLSGELVVLGTNFRLYDPAKKLWNIKWMDALAGTWTTSAHPTSAASISTAHPSPTS